MDWKKDNQEHLTFRAIYAGDNARASQQQKKPSDLRSILRELKVLRNKQAITAKKMETLLNEADYLADRVNVQISNKSMKRSRMEPIYELSRRSTQQQQSNTQREYYDYNNSCDPTEQNHLPFGLFGDQREQEKHDVFGNSQTWTNGGGR